MPKWMRKQLKLMFFFSVSNTSKYIKAEGWLWWLTEKSFKIANTFWGVGEKPQIHNNMCNNISESAQQFYKDCNLLLLPVTWLGSFCALPVHDLHTIVRRCSWVFFPLRHGFVFSMWHIYSIHSSMCARTHARVCILQKVDLHKASFKSGKG